MPITDRDWVLSTLGERTNPMGNGDRAPTLRLESASGRASGFAGCNRFSGPYTLSGDSLSFGPLVSTRMACAQGNDVEVSYLAALGNVRTFTAADSSLTLHGADAPVAIFRAQ
jgi:heat shock protein HslJ